MSIYLYLLFYFFLLLSILGYGRAFQVLFFKKDVIDFGYLGFFGIFSLLVISYLSNIFFPLIANFNLILLSFGFFFFLKFLFYNYSKHKKELLILFFLFLLLIVFILAAKNHDDFPYYHYPYIQLITKFSSSFGIGILNHGFRTPSSIFYFSSLFFLPKAQYALIHLGPVFFLGFTNYILIKKIYENLKNRDNFYIILLSLLSFALINIFFYRLAEHGTDRSAQILVLLIFIELLQLTNSRIFEKNLLNKIFLLITIVISLKAFYLIYLILIIPIIYYQKDKIFFFKELIKNKIFYLCLFLFFLVILTNFFNTGCLIYPLSLSCGESLLWSIPIKEVGEMNNWYELWSKGGAAPNFKVNNPDVYIEKFNWVSNWINIYFFNKISDYLLGLLFLITIFFLLLFNKKNSKFQKKRNYLFLYFIIFILIFEWFYNHPALRYGGYHLFALLFFVPFSFFIEKRIFYNKNLIKKINILIVIIIVIFFSRNILRINKEIKIYDYDFKKNSSYNKEFENNSIYNRITNLENCLKQNKDCKEDSIILLKFYNKNLFYRKK